MSYSKEELNLIIKALENPDYKWGRTVAGLWDETRLPPETIQEIISKERVLIVKSRRPAAGNRDLYTSRRKFDEIRGRYRGAHEPTPDPTPDLAEDSLKASKAQCLRLLAACDQAESTYEKGKSLEDLIESLFSSDDALVLSETRAITGDEEIDLVFVNNIDRPFWNALQSSMIFVECKNLRGRVGSNELLNFEGKLRNHASLARVGFFVGLNGFTSEAKNYLRRTGRSECHVVLIERDDIVQYLSSEVSLVDWLERLASRLY